MAQIVVWSAPTSAYQTSWVCLGSRIRSTAPVQSSIVSVRSGGSDTSSTVDDLVEAGPVEVDVAQVLLRGGLVGVDDPVAVDLLGERVERAEQCVRHGDRPDVTADPVPAGDRLGALDHHMLARGGGVGDATPVAEPAPPGLDPLAVLPAVDDDGVPGSGEGGGPVDGAERSVLGAVGVIGSGGRDVEIWMAFRSTFRVVGFGRGAVASGGQRPRLRVAEVRYACWGRAAGSPGSRYLLNPAVSPERLASADHVRHEERHQDSTTAARTAGMLTENEPWNDHSDSGSTRLSELWVRISGNRNPFHTLSAS